MYVDMYRRYPRTPLITSISFASFSTEREENVKSDIFLAYRALLQLTKPCIPRQPSDGDAMETPDRWVWCVVWLVNRVKPAMHGATLLSANVTGQQWQSCTVNNTFCFAVLDKLYCNLYVICIFRDSCTCGIHVRTCN